MLGAPPVQVFGSVFWPLIPDRFMSMANGWIIFAESSPQTPLFSHRSFSEREFTHEVSLFFSRSLAQMRERLYHFFFGYLCTLWLLFSGFRERMLHGQKEIISEQAQKTDKKNFKEKNHKRQILRAFFFQTVRADKKRQGGEGLFKKSKEGPDWPKEKNAHFKKNHPDQTFWSTICGHENCAPGFSQKKGVSHNNGKTTSGSEPICVVFYPFSRFSNRRGNSFSQ